MFYLEHRFRANYSKQTIPYWCLMVEVECSTWNIVSVPIIPKQTIPYSCLMVEGKCFPWKLSFPCQFFLSSEIRHPLGSVHELFTVTLFQQVFYCFCKIFDALAAHTISTGEPVRISSYQTGIALKIPFHEAVALHVTFLHPCWFVVTFPVE